jgi:hypothetical protein
VSQKHGARRYWFRTKTYGWGWTPVAWQGWAAIGAWAIVFFVAVLGAVMAADASSWAAFAVMIAVAGVATLALVYVSWRTGEHQRWRWGGDT